MAIQIKISGISKTKQFLKYKEKAVEDGASIGLKKAALHMQNEVKESIAGRKSEKRSVDTGRFLNSVDISIGKDDAAIFTRVPYAKYLEWGTSRLPARRHFNNSKARNVNKIKQILGQQIKKSI